MALRPLKKGEYRITVREDGMTEITVRSGTHAAESAALYPTFSTRESFVGFAFIGFDHQPPARAASPQGKGWKEGRGAGA